MFQKRTKVYDDSKYKEYAGESRKSKIKNLKSGFEQQTNFFQKKQE